jgi:hypothetical protein
MRRLLLPALLCAAALAPSTASAAVFARGSVWNAPLSASAPLDRDSAALVAGLDRQVAAYKPWINTDRFSTPVYTVPASQRRVKVVRRDGDRAAAARRIDPPQRAVRRPHRPRAGDRRQ